MGSVQKKVTELISIVQKKPAKKTTLEETEQRTMRHNCEFCQHRLKLISGGTPVGRFIKRTWQCPNCETQVVEKVYPGKNVIL